MRKILIIFVSIILLNITSGCGIINREYNNSINNKVVVVEDYTIEDLQSNIKAVTMKIEDSSVAIYDSNFIESSLGSGVIISRICYDKNGTVIDNVEQADYYEYYCVTNYHVVEKYSTRIKVYTKENVVDSSYQSNATLVKYNKDKDLALLKFTSKVLLVPVTFADSSQLRKGDFVIAIGTPLSLEYFNTTSFGIVSHPSRIVSNNDSENCYIQHDAAINPGNSGGGLFNIEGKFIGINTSRAYDKDTNVYGISFAVSSNIVYEEFKAYVK